MTPCVPFPVRATVAESRQVITACTELERVPGSALLDLSDSLMFGPFGVVALAAAIALRRGNGLETDVTWPAEAGCREFLDEVGLPRFVRGEVAPVGTLEVRQFFALDPTYTDAAARMLVRSVAGIDDAAAYTVTLCLNELLQNVFEWSESRVGCTALTRYYKKTRSVRLAVVDRGIGIPAELRRRQVQDLHRANDAEVIRQAVMRPRLTSRSNQVGGLGLKTIRETVCDRGGSLTILSLGAKVTWRGDRMTTAATPAFRGTAIEIDFRPYVTPPDTTPPLF